MNILKMKYDAKRWSIPCILIQRFYENLTAFIRTLYFHRNI